VHAISALNENWAPKLEGMGAKRESLEPLVQSQTTTPRSRLEIPFSDRRCREI
jgi:hypothetical protein